MENTKRNGNDQAPKPLPPLPHFQALRVLTRSQYARECRVLSISLSAQLVRHAASLALFAWGSSEACRMGK